VALFEAEQCSTPFVPLNERGYIDGIKFDEFGNPLWYDFLRDHPGSTSLQEITTEAEQVPADRVLHWFKVRRPGQHRGVPETSSTLNLGAAFRRLREATLSTAEKSAAWTLFLKTAFPPEVVATIAPLELLEINRGMMTTLPAGIEPTQLQAEQPGPNYTEFHRSLLNEQARPKNMPFNKAACDSASYNYASGRLDHQTYYAALDVDRADCNDMVLEPLFSAWFEMAALKFRWFSGRYEPGLAPHVWDWPKHRVADVEAEANANRTKLESGQIFLPQLYAESGVDFDDAIEHAAKKLRITEDELCKRLVDVTLPPPKQVAAPVAKPPAASAVLRHLAPNGVHLEN
jgi:capsid protein